MIGNALRTPCLLVIDDWGTVGTKDRHFVGEDWSTVSLEAILGGLGRERVRAYFESAYRGKTRLNVVMDGK